MYTKVTSLEKKKKQPSNSTYYHYPDFTVQEPKAPVGTQLPKVIDMSSSVFYRTLQRHFYIVFSFFFLLFLSFGLNIPHEKVTKITRMSPEN